MSRQYCPRKRSDMTPCVITDGPICYATDGRCVGCYQPPSITKVPFATPTPAPAPMTARLRELMEEATPGPVHIGGDIKTVDGWRVNLWSKPKPGNQSGEMVAQLLKKGDAELYEYLRNNAPTTLRLLEAVEGAEKALGRSDVALDTCESILREKRGPVHERVVNVLAEVRSTLATLRAAREGAR